MCGFAVTYGIHQQKEKIMKNETRKIFAEMLRARKAGRTGLIGGTVAEVMAWAARCGLAGPKGRLP